VSAHSTVFVIAVPAAIVGAASFGLASVVQQRVTKQVPMRRTLNPRLLLELVRKPVWVASVLTVMVGLSLQIVALAYGPLVLVQPLLVTTVLFGAMFAAWMNRRRVDRVVVLGALACVGGLSAFLLLAQPSGQGREFGGAAILPLALALGLLVVVCLTTATRFPGEIRVIAMALATGVLYGVTAGLIKVVAGQFREEGLLEPFQHWALYAVCVIGPMGFLLSQNTFQQGKLISPALAVITTADPLVGIAIGVSWLGEQVVASPLALAGEAVAALALIGGIAILTHRGEQLRQAAERAGADGYSSESTWG
jgi:drug/metabolite transporter (DMT)-like permease